MDAFNFSHIKDRYRKAVADRSINLHSTLAEMLGTGIIVLIGTSFFELYLEAMKNWRALNPGPVTGQPPALPDPLGRHTGYFESALIFGFTYFAVLCATRHHGGAHCNPAITIASFLAGVTPAIQAVVYIVVQVLGAIIASAIVLGLTPDDKRDDSLLGGNFFEGVPGITKDRAFGVEIIATFCLTYIYLQTFTHPRSEHKAIAPLAVGFAYTALLAATGPVSSASLNPARTLGPAAVAGEGDDLWIWIFGPIIGALIAVPAHLLSVTHLPETDKDGHVVHGKDSSVNVGNDNVKDSPV